MSATVPQDSDREPEGGWKRVHPLTPLIHSWQLVILYLVLTGQQTLSNGAQGQSVSLAPDLYGLSPVVAAGLAAVVLVLYLGSSVLAWRFLQYRLTSEAMEIRSGVLSRKHRVARLDRLQAVDVVQPLAARAVGLARLKVEVAGGSDSHLDLSFLTQTQAHGLRAELLARAAGVKFEGETAPAAPEMHGLEVGAPRLAASLFLRVPLLVCGIATIVLGIVSAVCRTFAPLLGILPLVLMLVYVLWDEFARGFAFRVASSPDGLRLRHGLLEHQAHTVPPGRVQALRVTQPVLWRRADWWKIQMIIAGYGQEVSNQAKETSSVLLPVGTREEVLGVLAMVLPDLGDTGEDTPRQIVEAGMTSTTSEHGFVTVPRRARPLDPVSYRRSGVRLTGAVFVSRHGRFQRTVDIVPHARIQSCGVKQGPVQRRLGVATFSLHTTPGAFDVRAEHLDTAVCAYLFDGAVQRANLARRTEGPEHWMER